MPRPSSSPPVGGESPLVGPTIGGESKAVMCSGCDWDNSWNISVHMLQSAAVHLDVRVNKILFPLSPGIMVRFFEIRGLGLLQSSSRMVFSRVKSLSVEASLAAIDTTPRGHLVVVGTSK